MATYNKFQDFIEQFGKGVHELHAAGHTLKAMLSNNAPAATDAVKADITEITGGNGYTEGGEDIQNDYTETGGVGALTGVDITWTASGGSIGPFRYVVLYNDTPTSPADPLVCWWDYGSSITLSSGQSFTLNFGSSILTIV